VEIDWIELEAGDTLKRRWEFWQERPFMQPRGSTLRRPSTGEELESHDPEMFALLTRLRQVQPQQPMPAKESER